MKLLLPQYISYMIATLQFGLHLYVAVALIHEAMALS